MTDLLDSVRVLVEPYGWEPRLTARNGRWRAWMRRPGPDDRRRMFGRPAASPEAAVAELERKVRRWVR